MENNKLDSLEIKKKHHYVWAYYLKQWAHGDDVWYISKKGGSICCDSVYGRSQDMHFYRISALTTEDIEFLRRFPLPDSPALKKIHASQLDFFSRLSIMINIPPGFEGSEHEAELKKLSEWASNNPLEDTYTTIELMAKPIMESLWKGDDSCLKVRSNMVSFCNFVAHQLARTKKMKDEMFTRTNKLHQDNEQRLKYAKLFLKNWWFIAYRTGITFGYGLTQESQNAHHLFIRNTTKIDFVTSDHPVINVHRCVKDESPSRTIDKLDLYYPISPKFAYMINDSQHYNHLSRLVTEEDVIALNLLIAENSHKNIYGSSEQALKDVRKSYRNLKG